MEPAAGTVAREQRVAVSVDWSRAPIGTDTVSLTVSGPNEARFVIKAPVFNPATPLNYMDHVMDKLDVVLLMSVNPGFGGQKFIPETLNKLRDARARIDAYTARTGRSIRLEIDGGVKVDNIAEIARAGADTFVAGSAVFGAGKDSDSHRYDSVIAALRGELASALDRLSSGLAAALETLAERFKPEFVLISAGFDAHINDPLAQLRLVEGDFAWVTEKLLEAAQKHTDGKLVSTLEGGYDLDALARSTSVHVATLMGA